jgi:LPXTG-motif cell wall-anchored protein
MRSSQITGIALGAFFAVTASAFAQTSPTQTFAGCLMTERDYRSAHNLGAGEVGGVGLGDEFVLVDVTLSPAKATAATPASGTPAVSASAQPTSPSKCADRGPAYRLTGSDEEQLKTLVGRHVEIQGRFKNADDVAAAGARPEGTLPAEVEMVSFREVPAPASVTVPTSAPTAQPTSAPVTPPPTAQTTPQPPTPVPATEARRELPATASSTTLFALIGMLALSSGLALTIIRRRVL